MGKIKRFFRIASIVIIPIIFIVLFVVAFIAGMKESTSNTDGDDFDGIYGDTIQEKVWWALKDCSFSDEQVAGAMGNIHVESDGFCPTRVEYGYDENTGGIGLCQWTNAGRGSERK